VATRRCGGGEQKGFLRITVKTGAGRGGVKEVIEKGKKLEKTPSAPREKKPDEDGNQREEPRRGKGRKSKACDRTYSGVTMDQRVKGGKGIRTKDENPTRDRGGGRC